MLILYSLTFRHLLLNIQKCWYFQNQFSTMNNPPIKGINPLNLVISWFLFSVLDLIGCYPSSRYEYFPDSPQRTNAFRGITGLKIVKHNLCNLVIINQGVHTLLIFFLCWKCLFNDNLKSPQDYLTHFLYILTRL